MLPGKAMRTSGCSMKKQPRNQAVTLVLKIASEVTHLAGIRWKFALNEPFTSWSAVTAESVKQHILTLIFPQKFEFSNLTLNRAREME